MVRDRLRQKGIGSGEVVVFRRRQWRQGKQRIEGLEGRKRVERHKRNQGEQERRQTEVRLLVQEAKERLSGRSPRAFGTRMLRRPFRHANHQRSPSRKFVLRDFRQEVQIDSRPRTFLASRVVEKINNVSAEALFDAAALIEIERARRIYFDLRTLAQYRSQVALESQRSLPHLCHGECDHAIRHSVKDWSTIRKEH